MVDEILKDEFKIHSQHTAVAFTNLFIFFNFTTAILALTILKDACPNFDHYWDEIDKHNLDFDAFSTRTKVIYLILNGIFYIYVISYIYFPFITVPLL